MLSVFNENHLLIEELLGDRNKQSLQVNCLKEQYQVLEMSNVNKLLIANIDFPYN